MTLLLTKLRTALTSALVLTAAVITLGLGFALMGALTLFAVVALGTAMIAAPFARKEDAQSAT